MAKNKNVNYNHIKAALDRKPRTSIAKLQEQFPEAGWLQLLAWTGRWVKERELATGLDSDGEPV